MDWSLIVRDSTGQKPRKHQFEIGRLWLAGRYENPADAVARAWAEGVSTDSPALSEAFYLPLEPDPGIARWHLDLFHHESEGPWVQDLGTRSGTRLNGKVIRSGQRVSLSLDDEIQVVKCRIHVAGTTHVNPDWLAWRDGTVVRMAQTIRNEGTLDDLPILADALEEAGCIEANVLRSCRERNKAARRSWVIDAILDASESRVKAASII